jgi:hypothetical protein
VISIPRAVLENPMLRALPPLLVASAAVAAPALKDNPAHYYPTRVGDTAVHEIRTGDRTRESVEVVTRVEEKGGALHVTSEFQMDGQLPKFDRTVEVSDTGVTRYAAVGRNLDTAMRMLRLPAKVGATWHFEFRSPAGEKRREFSYTITAVAEDVEVPAGRFKAIRVEGVSELQGRKTNTTTWYAPRVGMVKTVQASGEVETVSVLKAFTAGK